MSIAPFKLERYFAQYEFTARYLLSSSDCEALTLSEVLELADEETRELWSALRLGYTESQGDPLLRAEIAGLYGRISPEHVLVAAPEEGIFLAMNCLLESGDHVVCTFPGYQSLYQIAASLGCELSLWQPVESEGWRFDLGFLEQAIRPNTKLVVCNFPHNPTGYLPTQGEWQAIVDVIESCGIYLFSDEMYRFLELEPGDRLPSAVECYDRAVTLSGMSKAFGMAGVRLGWLVAKDQALHQRMTAFKDYTTICSSAPSEILSLIALRAKERIVSRHRQRIARNLSLLDGFFQEHSEAMAWVRPRAGSVCFPKLLGDISASALCKALVEEAGIMLLPSTVYDYGDRHFRLGFGRESLPEALQRFGEYLTHRYQQA